MSFITPRPKPRTGASMRPKALQRSNPVRMMREQEEKRQAERAAAAVATVAKATRPGGGKQCPNKSCTRPNVVDGTCRSCGRVADDSNIVSEITFGETSGGAAVVQGSYIGADQGGVRSYGPNFRRIGGSSDEREKSIREARLLMQGFAMQLNVSESIVASGVQAFKLASSANFIQGRTLPMVAAVCLYAACRNEPPCKIMLIDLADLTQINVFRLGRTFKALNKAVPVCSDGLVPVYPEDLIYRFASKLEFFDKTTKVAEDAVRLVRRMSRDWMVMGRRPSGICGACLLMAARLNNFRRTVREVVYIVKVTNHTIQSRLEEFKVTESSNMTVEDFLTQDFLESSHDPPSFYRKSAEEQKAITQGNTTKRKRVTEAVGDEDDEEEDSIPIDPRLTALMTDQPSRSQQDGVDGLPTPPSERNSQAPQSTPGDNSNTEGTPTNTQLPDLSSIPAPEYRRDADGFIIPPLPSVVRNLPTLGDPNNNTALAELAESYGDEEAVPANTGSQPKKGKEPKSQLPVDSEDWERDENSLEEQISEIFNDPQTMEHAMAFSNAEQRAQLHSLWALQKQPQKQVSMDEIVGEDEFANDPEVIYCLLSPEETVVKERIWVNENRDFLRKQQEAVFRKKAEADKPKVTRRRRKKPRIGEAQTSPASTPAEAAVNVMKERAFSTRINYDAIRSLFDMPGSPDSESKGDGGVGGAGEGKGDVEPDDDEDLIGGDEEEEEAEEEVYDETGYDDDDGDIDDDDEY
ncbi:related to transcription factor IIIB [Cephalotrichum gorgonifer]|uniref:Related to transcription factor IIIB n=1 Tax=Cephalotrichum gorgonifer TaxID=2041049 RepID=A0AAE8N314_9PEZI|nr:related to transcription factor IIIB [Cephalotrichum gorgonifer]